MESRRNYIQNMFNRFRRPLKLKEGDYAYVYAPHDTILRKFQPRATGPFPVTHIHRLKGTNEPMAVELNIGTEDVPILKTFARYRILPLQYSHRDINWPLIERRAKEKLSIETPNQESIDDQQLTFMPLTKNNNHQQSINEEELQNFSIFNF